MSVNEKQITQKDGSFSCLESYNGGKAVSGLFYYGRPVTGMRVRVDMTMGAK
jgi:hypothetical protein